MSTINGVSGSSNVWAALNTQRSQQQAKMFAKADTDNSGGVDQTELDTMLGKISEKTGVSLGDTKELFTKMDSNGDGSLSSDELAAGMKALVAPASNTMEFAQSHSKSSSGNQEDLFAKVDSNGDGSINQDELKVLAEKIKEYTGQDVSQDLAKLDTDGDGTLSKTEFEAARPPAPENSKAAQSTNAASSTESTDGPGDPGAVQSASSSNASYDPLDVNQDGVVSEMERMVGELKKAIAGLSSNDASTQTTNQQIAELAQKIYAQVANGLTESNSGSLSAMA